MENKNGKKNEKKDREEKWKAKRKSGKKNEKRWKEKWKAKRKKMEKKNGKQNEKEMEKENEKKSEQKKNKAQKKRCTNAQASRQEHCEDTSHPSPTNNGHTNFARNRKARLETFPWEFPRAWITREAQAWASPEIHLQRVGGRPCNLPRADMAVFINL